MTNREIIERWFVTNAAKVGTPEAPTMQQLMDDTGLNHAEIIIACDEHNKTLPPWVSLGQFNRKEP